MVTERHKTARDLKMRQDRADCEPHAGVLLISRREDELAQSCGSVLLVSSPGISKAISHTASPHSPHSSFASLLFCLLWLV